MTLIPCRECWQNVSSEAKTCPHCGAPDPVPSLQREKDRRAVRYAIVATVLLALLLVAFFTVGM